MTPKDWRKTLASLPGEQAPGVLPFFADWLEERGVVGADNFRTPDGRKHYSVKKCVQVHFCWYLRSCLAPLDDSVVLSLTINGSIFKMDFET